VRMKWTDKGLEYRKNKGRNGVEIKKTKFLKAGSSQVRFPMVSLEFFTDIILSVALWSWSRLSL
jgi:hypothetical protein